jgi:hypothetical protein
MHPEASKIAASELTRTVPGGGGVQVVVGEEGTHLMWVLV